MKGDSTAYTTEVMGTMGVPSPNNTPLGLYEACQWTDLQGNFWLYGGVDKFSKTHANLWEFNPLTNQWTWIGGSTGLNLTPTYGIKGVPSINNSPGSRGWGTITWTDSIGDLWLLGGCGYLNYYNDLWRYNITTNEWTWMNGSNLPNQLGVCGTKGVPSPLNTPSARSETSCSWVVDEDLWLFGGRCYFDSLGNGTPTGDDLWKYNVTTNEWTWMKGNNNIYKTTIYGIKGIEDSINTPGSRMVYCSWKDNCNNLWLFGGMEGNTYNDVWRYNIITNNWTWESGSNISNGAGIYNGFCNASINNYPSVRGENRACWNDKCGNLWTFGGGSNYGWSNDLWYFNSSTKEWTLVSGSSAFNQIGKYGIKTVSNSTNVPGGRIGSVSWKDVNGNLWLFGGEVQYQSYNDLWRYKPDSTCPIVSCQGIVSNNKTLCRGDSTILSATGGQHYLWNTGDTTSSINVHPLITTTYSVKISNQTGCPLLRYVTVVVNSVVINLGNDTTLCIGQTILLNAINQNATYHWQDNTTVSTYNVTQQGVYWVKVTDTNGCSNSDTIKVNFVQYPTFNLGNDTTLCIGQTLLLNATSQNATYHWQDNSTAPIYNVSQHGVYWVKVNDVNCSKSDTININYIDCDDTAKIVIPNIITPNGDGINDYFVIKGADNYNVSVKIYNRWGVKVYEDNNYLNNWNGTFNGKPLSDGTYYYIIKASYKYYKKEKDYHGSVTILR